LKVSGAVFISAKAKTLKLLRETFFTASKIGEPDESTPQDPKDNH
jgi:hypothetical protein